MGAIAMSAVAKMMKGLIVLYSQMILVEAGVIWVRGKVHVHKTHMKS